MCGNLTNQFLSILIDYCYQSIEEIIKSDQKITTPLHSRKSDNKCFIYQ